MAVFDSAFSGSDDPVKRQATRAVHNYFFLKAIDVLRESGLLTFITSQGVMNSPTNEPVRRWLMDHANLVSAIRLPNNLMSDNAGTEVGSDLIILQKNTVKTSLTPEEKAFLSSRTLSNGAHINNYFRDFSRVVHTKGFSDKDLYGKPGMTFLHEGGVTVMAVDVKKMLSADFANFLNRKLYEDHLVQMLRTAQPAIHVFNADNLADTKNSRKEQAAPSVEVNVNVEQQPLTSLYELFGISEADRRQSEAGKKKSKNHRTGLKARPRQLDLFSPVQNSAHAVTDTHQDSSEEENRRLQEPHPYSGMLEEHHKHGSLVVEQNGQLGFLKERYRNNAVFKSLTLNSAQEQRAKMYIQIRDTYHSLYNYEATEWKENRDLRQSLNERYDAFVKRYGYLTRPQKS